MSGGLPYQRKKHKCQCIGGNTVSGYGIMVSSIRMRTKRLRISVNRKQCECQPPTIWQYFIRGPCHCHMPYRVSALQT
ncbi:hypothetical protein DPMN_050540 [Dreissena polymorpha]|uniref:Uncharacterized protein n=1 Tax=Dreissena polymorpha TaxID=45954 RepID=A0A9D4CHR0_DREPO|nr:hypothetical protein DPMN_050540 [Dreissena polymorpha]